MRSSLSWAVLGLVIERPSYGFELLTRCERLYGDVLSVNSSAVYYALDQLVKRGLVEKVSDARQTESSGQPRPHYFVSREGLEAYEERVATEAREHSRSMVQFAHSLGALADQPLVALAILERFERACLDDMTARIPTTTEFPRPVVPGLGDRLASAYGRSVKAGMLAWISAARRELEVLAGDDGAS